MESVFEVALVVIAMAFLFLIGLALATAIGMLLSRKFRDDVFEDWFGK